MVDIDDLDCVSTTSTATLLGTETTLECVPGAGSSDAGLSGLYLPVARTTGAGYPIAASASRRPVSTADDGIGAVEGSG